MIEYRTVVRRPSGDILVEPMHKTLHEARFSKHVWTKGGTFTAVIEERHVGSWSETEDTSFEAALAQEQERAAQSASISDAKARRSLRDDMGDDYISPDDPEYDDGTEAAIGEMSGPCLIPNLIDETP